MDAERASRPGEQLAVMIDVDGSLLDLRPGLVELLAEWDARQGTRHFAGLAPEQVVPGEAGLRRLFDARGLDYTAREELLVECERFAWSPEAVIGAHRHCLGMLEVVRWMQMQPGVECVLNSSRSETRREETLQALRTLCRHYGVSLREDRVHLNPFGDGQGGERAKIEGIEATRARGLRPIAVVDDDPAALRAIRGWTSDPSLLCIESAPPLGRDQITEPAPVSVVWRGLEDATDLELFGAANVPWAEVRLVRSASGGLATVPRRGTPIELEDLVGCFAQLGRAMRLRFDEPRAAVRALGALAMYRFPWEQVAVRLAPDQLTDEWFDHLAPHRDRLAVVADVGFLDGAIGLGSDLVAEFLLRLTDRGVRRIAVPADATQVDTIRALARAAGLEVELAAPAGLGAYVDAVFAGADAVSTDFDRARSRGSERAAPANARRRGALRI
ncbi:MAG: hypothetical protein R3F34_19850 [Planctomycetota bacterium]